MHCWILQWCSSPTSSLVPHKWLPVELLVCDRASVSLSSQVLWLYHGGPLWSVLVVERIPLNVGLPAPGGLVFGLGSVGLPSPLLQAHGRGLGMTEWKSDIVLAHTTSWVNSHDKFGGSGSIRAALSYSWLDPLVPPLRTAHATWRGTCI